VIHLDTHVVVWLAERSAQFSPTARRLVQREALFFSPAVDFELEVLAEVGRLKSDPERILRVATRDYNLVHSAAPFIDVVGRARSFAWTRDPFDRLIVANAMAEGVRLLTADAHILEHFVDAVW
jgi:PIN domain nuclease of toxin-antitoxin system